MSTTPAHRAGTTSPARLTTPSETLAVLLLTLPVSVVLVLLERLDTTGPTSGMSAHIVLLGVLFAFSPLPISIPAVLLDNHRDAVLPHWNGPRLIRGLLLLPLLLARTNPARLAVAASLIGWVAAAAVATWQVPDMWALVLVDLRGLAALLAS